MVKEETRTDPSLPSEPPEGFARVECPHCKREIDVLIGPALISCQFCDGKIQTWGPQPGPQTQFLNCNGIDIVVYGGTAGCGKTWAELMEPLKHIDNPRFRCTIFRRTCPQITNHGGLWDASTELYPMLGARPRQTDLEWTFPSGARVKFAHLEHEKNKHDYDGAEIDLIEFDELEHFPASMFFYILSRSRSTTGVKPYIRATLNPPDPNQPEGMWLHDFLAPWVDPKHPHKAEPGEVRYFVRDLESGTIEWVPAGTPWATSVTFLPGKLSDNKILMEKDPTYEAKLRALPYEDRQRLLEGSWNIKRVGQMFKREWFKDKFIDPEALPQGLRLVRIWDKAATENNGKGAFTEGVKMGCADGRYYVISEVHVQAEGAAVLDLMKATAQADGYGVEIFEEREPSASGKIVGDLNRRTTFAGYSCKQLNPGKEGDKITRAKPAASAVEAGNVFLVRGDWNEPWLDEVCLVPFGRWDRADAFAWGVLVLGGSYVPSVEALKKQQEANIARVRLFPTTGKRIKADMSL
jgi:phage terminase large subunit-like protein